MGSSGEVKGGQATYVCSCTTVFEGAVIGQVFTGDVQMQCPHAYCNRSTVKRHLHRFASKAVSAAVALTIIDGCSTASSFHELVYAYVAIRAIEWMDSRLIK
jgi:hypothetical protein